jgi:hypothetical protein
MVIIASDRVRATKFMKLDHKVTFNSVIANIRKTIESGTPLP